ncbi:MAG: chemotaxis protein CheW [Candidatus Muiribacteriota bacterium]
MSELHMAGFKLGNEEYAVDINKVKEVIKMTDITKIPESDSYIEGEINLRGKNIPVINLKTILGVFSELVESGEKKIFIFDFKNKSIGVLVDMFTEVLRLDSSKVDFNSESGVSVDKKYIKGIGKYSNDRTLSIIDIEKILEETVF